MVIFFLSLTKSESKRAEQILPLVAGTSGRGEEVGEGYGRVTVLQIVCTYVCKWKNDAC
jgi:hypothetical protein